MSTAAIIAIAVCALLGWCALVEAVKAVLVARAACPCRKLTHLTVEPGMTPSGRHASSLGIPGIH